MAVQSIVRIEDLVDGKCLSPERYDPRRQMIGSQTSSSLLGSVANISSRTMSLHDVDPNATYRVLDTGDSFEGFVWPRRGAVDGTDIKSSKKILEPGDVIISRLRPYLRQVAFVDNYLFSGVRDVVCSTEYFVIRGKTDEQSIAYMVPYLLSERVQRSLSYSQEGGHHPRFNLSVLKNLEIDDSIIQSSQEISSIIVDAVREMRKEVEKLHRISIG